MRLATPAGTTRGFGLAEFTKVGELIVRVLDALAANEQGDAAVEAQVRAQVLELTGRYPIYA